MADDIEVFTQLVAEFADSTGAPASKILRVFRYLGGKTSQSEFERALSQLQARDAFEELVKSAVEPGHESIRAGIIKIVELLGRLEPAQKPHHVLSHSYLLGEGFVALHEVAGAGLSIRRLGGMFRWELEPLRFAVQVAKAAELAGDGSGYYADVHRLREKGAPIPSSWRYGDLDALAVLFSLGFDEHVLFRSCGERWDPLEGYPCDGFSMLDVFGSHAESIKNWARENLAMRNESGADEALLPVLELREPNFAGLLVSPGEGEVLHVSAHTQGGSETFAFPLSHLAGRELFIPIGTYFEAKKRQFAGRSFVASSELEIDPTAEGYEIRGKELKSALDVSDVDFFSRQDFVGPTFFPTHLKIDDGPKVDVRSPRLYNLYERISGWWAGASCPEVFTRWDGCRWRHLGSVLVEALGAERARSEELELARRNGYLEVVLREVPGEVAMVSAELVVRHANGHETVLDERWNVRLDPRTVLLLCASVQLGPEERVLLRVRGFFERARATTRASGFWDVRLVNERG